MAESSENGIVKHREGAASILYSLHQGKIYYLTVERTHTRKWDKLIMMGPAETRESEKVTDRDYGVRGTMIRGIWEEIEQKAPSRQIRITPFKEPINGVVDERGYTAHFFRVKVPYARLEAIRDYIKEHQAEKFFELANPRIVDIHQLAAIDRSRFQPHTAKILDSIIAHHRLVSDRYQKLKPFIRKKMILANIRNLAKKSKTTVTKLVNLRRGPR